MSIVARVFVSAAPQLLQPDLNADYQKLIDGCQRLQQEFESLGVERILYWSTQWLSVLGQLYQAGSDLRGVHVDENWHASCELPFDFVVDRDLSAALNTAGESAGFPGQCVDYADFPVDTATIIADRILNPHRLPVSMVACNVYCNGDQTRKLSSALSQVLEKDSKKTAVVAVSLLTTSYHTVSIDVREDHVRGESEHKFIDGFIAAVENGSWLDLNRILDHDVKSVRTDMGLKAVDWLRGTMPEQTFAEPWRVFAKSPLYGASGIVARIQ